MLMTNELYGKVGTTTVITVESVLGSTLAGYVKMKEKEPPKDGKFYVIGLNGNWEEAVDNTKIREERQRRYLEAWPVPKQLEAQQDLVNGDATKWNEMQIDFKKIKEELPYTGVSIKPYE